MYGGAELDGTVGTEGERTVEESPGGGSGLDAGLGPEEEEVGGGLVPEASFAGGSENS